MTLAFSTRRNGPYQGTGSNTVFAFTFPIDATSELAVVKFDQTTETFSVLSEGPDYSVSIANSEVTLSVALLATESLTILGRSALSQLTDINLGELTASQIVETAIDFVTRLQQEAIELFGRAIVIDEAEAGDVYKSGSLPVGVRIVGMGAVTAGQNVTFTCLSEDPHVLKATGTTP